jgi:hypothetical protein
MQMDFYWLVTESSGGLLKTQRKNSDPRTNEVLVYEERKISLVLISLSSILCPLTFIRDEIFVTNWK